MRPFASSFLMRALCARQALWFRLLTSIRQMECVHIPPGLFSSLLLIPSSFTHMIRGNKKETLNSSLCLIIIISSIRCRLNEGYVCIQRDFFQFLLYFATNCSIDPNKNSNSLREKCWKSLNLNDELRPSPLLQPSNHFQRELPLGNRAILYQMLALYDYNAQGAEDLDFSEGDTIDVLNEGERFETALTLVKPRQLTLPLSTTCQCFSLPVNEEWLEGRCGERVGIFPGCFAYRVNANAKRSSLL